jgi:uncharacterized membrane protein
MLLSMLACSACESCEVRGTSRTGMTLGGAGAIGFAAELLGVATDRPFGRYHYSSALGPKLGDVPLLAAAAWSIMARPAWVTAGWVAPRALARVPLAAAALTAWDVYLDPRMVADGYWTWSHPGRYAGIPATNFAGWFVTGCVVFAAFAVIDGAPPTALDDGALALYAWTWVGEAIANGLLWRRRVPAIAGAITMGAVAAPALRRRRHHRR